MPHYQMMLRPMDFSFTAITEVTTLPEQFYLHIYFPMEKNELRNIIIQNKLFY